MARIIKLDYAKMIKIAKDVSKKCDKSFPGVFFDMIHCGMKFQAGYHDYQEFEFYHLNEEQRATYLTRGKNNNIIKKYNDKEYMPIFDDKIAFNKKFSQFLNRDWLDMNETTPEQFRDFMSKHPAIIAKPVDGEGGFGVEKYLADEHTDLDELYRSIKEKKQILVEAFIRQHPDMNVLYPDSVNSMRMFTFCKDGKGCFLQAILKIGNGGVVDNFSSGGMYTFPNDEGIVTVAAIDKDDILYTKHPITGTDIIGFHVPMFDEAVELVKKAAEVIPQVGYVGWDVAISDQGPVIIEGNSFPGIFQKRASLSENKTGVIPRYRKYMDI
ncbi:MAG: hexapeptide transferase [Clostridia bacterium]|nr:hexapeptide transferase [Clostridia bacterium]